jgi:hypothetical protein
MSKPEQEAFYDKILHEYGCKMIIKTEEVKKSSGNNKKDSPSQEKTIIVRGLEPSLAFKLLSNHPFCQVNISMTALYPDYWTKLKETKEKENESQRIVLDPNCKIFVITYYS